jgi:hypothetical protein
VSAPAGTWRRSSHCQNGECVEVVDLPNGDVGVRDSKNICGPMLRFTPDEWVAFIRGVHKGEFDTFRGLTSPAGESC